MNAPAERPLTDREYQSLAQFRAELRRFLSFSEAAARAEGLTPAQHQLLLAVRGSDAEGLTPSLIDIAEHLQLKLHSAGELVNRATEQGLVERRADPADARRVLVAATATGTELLERLSVLHRRELRRFRTDMSRLLDTLEE